VADFAVALAGLNDMHDSKDIYGFDVDLAIRNPTSADTLTEEQINYLIEILNARVSRFTEALDMYDTVIGKYKSRRDEFVNRVGVEIDRYVAIISRWFDVRKKTGKVELPAGKVFKRRMPQSVAVEDLKTFIQWVTENGRENELLKIEPEIAKIHKYIKEYGEIPAGVELVGGDRSRIYVRLECQVDKCLKSRMMCEVAEHGSEFEIGEIEEAHDDHPMDGVEAGCAAAPLDVIANEKECETAFEGVVSEPASTTTTDIHSLHPDKEWLMLNLGESYTKDELRVRVKAVFDKLNLTQEQRKEFVISATGVENPSPATLELKHYEDILYQGMLALELRNRIAQVANYSEDSPARPTPEVVEREEKKFAGSDSDDTGEDAGEGESGEVEVDWRNKAERAVDDCDKIVEICKSLPGDANTTELRERFTKRAQDIALDIRGKNRVTKRHQEAIDLMLQGLSVWSK
jgi:hypothetical protein